MSYAHLPSREIERLSRSIAPGAWGIESEQPLSTLLGSCVAVCMYDKAARIGRILAQGEALEPITLID